MTKKELQRNETRANLIRCAIEVFSIEGYYASNVRKITDRAGLGYGTFYHYFTDKEDILKSIVDLISEHIGDYTHLRDEPHDSVLQTMYIGTLDILNYVKENKDAFKIILGISCFDTELYNYCQKPYTKLFARIDRDIRYFYSLGFLKTSITDDYITANTNMLSGLMNGIITDRIPEHKIPTMAESFAAYSYYTLIK